MNTIRILFLFCFISFSITAQVIGNDVKKVEIVETELDTVFKDTIQLEEIYINKKQLNTESLKAFNLLRNRVYVTYPYAKLAAERLTALNYGMSKLTTAREKKKYFKIVEDYLNNVFEDRLKKLSRKQGQILVKLIHRQTGVSTYDLIKNLKSGWKAFWSNTAARMFDINLKMEYQPYQSNEDYLIETILVRAFESGRLINQPPAKPIKYDDLTDFWVNKAVKEEK